MQSSCFFFLIFFPFFFNCTKSMQYSCVHHCVCSSTCTHHTCTYKYTTVTHTKPVYLAWNFVYVLLLDGLAPQLFRPLIAKVSIIMTTYAVKQGLAYGSHKYSALGTVSRHPLIRVVLFVLCL